MLENFRYFQSYFDENLETIILNLFVMKFDIPLEFQKISGFSFKPHLKDFIIPHFENFLVFFLSVAI